MTLAADQVLEALAKVQKLEGELAAIDSRIRSFISANCIFVGGTVAFRTGDITARPALEGELRKLEQERDRLRVEFNSALQRFATFN